jgi:hypothetical protein
MFFLENLEQGKVDAYFKSGPIPATSSGDGGGSYGFPDS